MVIERQTEGEGVAPWHCYTELQIWKQLLGKEKGKGYVYTIERFFFLLKICCRISNHTVNPKFMFMLIKLGQVVESAIS